MSTATGPTVVITVPKFMAITQNSSTGVLPKLRPAPIASGTNTNNSMTKSAIVCTSNSGSEDTPKAKKRRLDHLTWEEKVQRKKLKNRVAAQTSRDRKKARMEEMEYDIKELSQRTEILQNKCESLQTINDSLLAKNQKLDMEVEILRQQLTEIKEKNLTKIILPNCDVQTKVVESCAGCASIFKGSAVSNSYTDPLQQGLVDPQSAQRMLEQQIKKCNTMASLWKIVALCLLYKTCCSSTIMRNLMHDDLRSWPKVYSQISQRTWKQALERAVNLLPKLQAKESDCLDHWWGPQQKAWNPAEIEVMA